MAEQNITLKQQTEILAQSLKLSPAPLNATLCFDPLLFLLQKAGLPLGLSFRRGDNGLETAKSATLISLLKQHPDIFAQVTEDDFGTEQIILIAKGTAPLEIGGMLSTSVEHLLKTLLSLEPLDLTIVADLLWFLRKGSMPGPVSKEQLSKAIDDVKQRKPISCTAERIKKGATILLHLKLLDLEK